jgi:hypothetical protein
VSHSDFSDLNFALASIVDRNLGMKLLDALVANVKVITIIDWNNIRVEVEAVIIALNRLNLPSAGQVLYVLPDLLDLSILFLGREIERVVDPNAFKSMFKQISFAQLRAIFKKYEVG